MRKRILLMFAALAVGRVVAAQQRPSTRATNHPELTALYVADQADRAPSMLAGLSPGSRDSTMHAVLARDTLRRARVEALMKHGVAKTAADFYHAAIVVEHGRDTSASLTAHAWARRAVELDPSHAAAKRLMAGSWDQYQYGLGRPQWYGTMIRGGLREPARLYDVDTTRVTDAERRQLGLPSLAEMRARVDTLNARRPPD